MDESLVEEVGEVGVGGENEEAGFLVGFVDGGYVVEEFGVAGFVLGGRGERGEDVEAAVERHDECVY